MVRLRMVWSEELQCESPFEPGIVELGWELNIGARSLSLNWHRRSERDDPELAASPSYWVG